MRAVQSVALVSARVVVRLVVTAVLPALRRPAPWQRAEAWRRKQSISLTGHSRGSSSAEDRGMGPRPTYRSVTTLQRLGCRVRSRPSPEIGYSDVGALTGPNIRVTWTRHGPRPNRSEHPGFGAAMVSESAFRQLAKDVKGSFSSSGWR